jgi:mannose-1-phosphate guanylyltransferase
MAEEGQLHMMDLAGFWADVGQPKDFLVGTRLYLKSLSSKHPEELKKKGTTDYDIIGNVLIHPEAKIGKGCKIGPDVVVGKATVGDGVRLSGSVIMSNANIKDVMIFIVSHDRMH